MIRWGVARLNFVYFLGSAVIDSKSFLLASGISAIFPMLLVILSNQNRNTINNGIHLVVNSYLRSCTIHTEINQVQGLQANAWCAPPG